KAPVHTTGDLSSGVMAQSLAGAGGHAGWGMSGQLSSAGLTADIGGDGAQGGMAGQVVVLTEASIATQGKRSDGILAQSVGGAGGSGGVVAAAGLSKQANFSALIGGSSAQAGHAQAVNVRHQADL